MYEICADTVDNVAACISCSVYGVQAPKYMSGEPADTAGNYFHANPGVMVGSFRMLGVPPGFHPKAVSRGPEPKWIVPTRYQGR